MADLSVKLQKVRQKQDEERRRLTELRTLLRSSPGMEKEVPSADVHIPFLIFISLIYIQFFIFYSI